MSSRGSHHIRHLFGCLRCRPDDESVVRSITTKIPLHPLTIRLDQNHLPRIAGPWRSRQLRHLHDYRRGDGPTGEVCQIHRRRSLGLRLLPSLRANIWGCNHSTHDLEMDIPAQVSRASICLSPLFKLSNVHSIPPGVLAAVALILLLPNGFPHHNQLRERSPFRESFEKAFRRIDILGGFSLVAATVLLVTGLDEANEQYAWRSAFTIAVLTISGVLWILFVVWERWVTLNAGIREPVFPWRFFQNRVWMAMLL